MRLSNTLQRSWCLALCLAAGGAQAQAAAPSSCNAPSPAIRADAPARIPVEISNNHVLVTVCVGKRSLLFILDTGAGGDVIDMGVARELGLRLGKQIRVTGAGPGAAQGAVLAGARVHVPGVPGEFPLNTTFEMRRLRLAKGKPILGILGHPFIDRYVMAIDYRAGELRLYDRKSFAYSGGGAPVPITIENNQPTLLAELALADGEHIPVKCVVDVGSTQSLLITKPVVDKYTLRTRVGRTMPWGSSGGVGGAVTSTVGRVASLAIGPVSLTAVTTSLFGDSAGVLSDNRLWDANIGGEILRRFTVYFDYGGKRMILEPHAGTTEPFEADMSGMRILADTGLTAVRVVAVNAGSPAAEAGLLNDDVILRVNGQDMTPVMAESLRERLRHEGVPIELVVRRGSAVLTLQFVTRRQV